MYRRIMADPGSWKRVSEMLENAELSVSARGLECPDPGRGALAAGE